MVDSSDRDPQNTSTFGHRSLPSNILLSMRIEDEAVASLPPVNVTLTWIVVLMRVLGWAWMIALTLISLGPDEVSGVEPETAVLVVAMVMATVGAGLMVYGRQRGFLGHRWYVGVDGLISAFLMAAGWLSGASDFVAGGYPMSWLFLVAYATSLRGTVVASLVFSIYFAWLHLLMGLPLVRVVGSVQFLVVAFVAGWAFDTLRQRESLRLNAEIERRKAEELLAEERANAARLEERSTLATRLHDSVLQTLELIGGKADDPDEVRYLARIQARELRGTINEYRSQFEDGFRKRVLDAVGDVEDRYRVEIDAVVGDDVEMNQPLEALVGAVHEALTNSAKHSESKAIDLYAHVSSGEVRVSVRDRGKGFDPASVGSGGLAHSIVNRIRDAGGRVEVKSSPGAGTEISLFMPRM